MDGSVSVSEADPATATTVAGEDSSSAALPALQKRDWCGRWVVGSPEFHSQLVGAKSINTLAMSRRLPHWVRQPVSLALPFGTFEQALAEPANARLAGEIASRSEALRGAGAEGVPRLLAEIRELVMQLHSPEGLREMFREWCFDSNVCYPGMGGMVWNDDGDGGVVLRVVVLRLDVCGYGASVLPCDNSQKGCGAVATVWHAINQEA